MISTSMSLSATSSMHGRRINRCVLPIVAFAVASDERLGPDLPRGRGKSIGEDLNVDNEGSEQNFEPLQSLHHPPLVVN
jgi:hypothetical protein